MASTIDDLVLNCLAPQWAETFNAHTAVPPNLEQPLYTFCFIKSSSHMLKIPFGLDMSQVVCVCTAVCMGWQ